MNGKRFLQAIVQSSKVSSRARGTSTITATRIIVSQPPNVIPVRTQASATTPYLMKEVSIKPEYQEGQTKKGPQATGSKILENRKVIQVQWEGDYPTYYPYLWLRDNCQCQKCFHPFTKARKLLMQDLSMDSVPREVKVDSEQELVIVTWDDGHESPLPFDWLKDHNFTEHARQNRNSLRNSNPVLWGRELQKKVPRVKFPLLMEDDKELYNYLTFMELYGLCVMEDTPLESGQVEKAAKRISFIRNCHYGEIHQVVAKALPSNLAYTSGPLGLHTDFPFDRYPPGMLILHCIKQTDSEGGDSEYGDTFFVAEIMRRDYPDYFKILTTTPVDFIDVGSDAYGQFNKLTRHPTFLLDLEGKVMRTHYSNQTRDSFLNIPIERVDPFLRALRKFDDLMYQNHITFKLKAGETVSFDNTRVLHGRKGFTISGPDETVRWLESTFVDIDEINSKRRILKHKLGVDRFQ